MMRHLALSLVLALLAVPLHAATPAGWRTYHDARGFSVSYPRDWKADPSYYDADYPVDGNEPPRLRALAIKPIGDLDPGSSLDSGGVHILILPLPSFRAECTASSFIAYPAPDHGYSYDTDTPDFVHVVGDEPGGWYTSEDYVWKISDHPCFAVHYAFSYHAADSDQAKSEKPFDRVKLLKLLDKIRRTVALDTAR